MKTNNLRKVSVVLVAIAVAVFPSIAKAQDSSVKTSPPAATVSTNESHPSLSSGASEILKLAQAKLGDDTIIAYIKSSGDSFVLNAEQIIYLKQQGVSEVVITTMLNQTTRNPTTGNNVVYNRRYIALPPAEMRVLQEYMSLPPEAVNRLRWEATLQRRQNSMFRRRYQ